MKFTNKSSEDKKDSFLEMNSSKNCCDSLWSILQSFIPQINLPSPSARTNHDIENGVSICPQCEANSLAAAVFNAEYCHNFHCDHVKESLTTGERDKKVR